MNNLLVYNKFKKLHNKMTRLVEELEVQSKNIPDISVQNVKKGANPEDVSSGVILDLAKVTKSTNRKKALILNEGARVSEVGAKLGKITEFQVKNMIVDLTKLINALKKAEANLEGDELKNIEEIRKTFRYFVTAWQGVERKIKEAEAKKQSMLDELEKTDYERELEALDREYEEFLSKYESRKNEIRSKYGVEDIESIDDIVEDQMRGMTAIEEDMRAKVREIRDVVKEFVNIPQEIANTAKIYVTAMGATGLLSKNPTKTTVTKEGIEKILNTPELLEQLRDFLKITVVQDSFQVINVSLPEIKGYFSELETNVDSQLRSFEDSEKLDESAFTDIIRDTFKSFVKRTKDVLGSIKKIISPVSKKLESLIKPMSFSMDGVQTKIDDFKENATKFLAELEAINKQAEADVAKRAVKELS